MKRINKQPKPACRAVVINGIREASLENMQISDLKKNEVLVRVAYVGVCKTDLEIFNGTLGYYENQIAKYPIIPGHEVSGVIADVGQNVTHLKIGDSVVVECIQGCGLCSFCQKGKPIGCFSRTELGVIGQNGGYSELMTVPARFVQLVPPTLDLKKSCLSEPVAVVIKGLRRLSEAWEENPKIKECAVIGAGPIGRLSALVLVHRGHFVTIFEQDERRLKNVESKIEISQSLDNLEKFEAIIEATGEQSALKTVIEKSCVGVAILLLGLPYGLENFSFEQIVAYDKTIVGSVGSNASDFAEALALLPQLNTSSLTQKVLPLKEFKQAWEFARTRSELKVLLNPREI